MTLALGSFFIVNMSIYPLVALYCPVARDIATVCSVAFLVALIAVIGWRPHVLDFRALTGVSMACALAYLALCVAGSRTGSAALLALGVVFESACEAWVVVMAYTALARLGVKRGSMCASASFVAAYLAEAMMPRPLPFVPAAHVMMLAVIVLAAYGLARPVFDKLACQEPVLDLAATNPRSFLKLNHLLYVTVFAFALTQGVALSFSSENGIPSIQGLAVVPLALVFAYSLARRRMVNADWLFILSALLVIAGLQLAAVPASGLSPSVEIGATSLLDAGAACFNLLSVLFVVYFSEQNEANSPLMAAYIMALDWMGIEVGAIAGFALDAIAMEDGTLLFWASFAGSVAFALFCLVVIRKIDFMQLKDRMLPLDQGADDAEPSLVERPGLHERCAQVAKEAGLTPRESEVLEYLACGRSLAVIQEKLVVSANTVRFHTKNIYAKLGVHSKQEIIDLVESGGENSS